ncbi:MAG: geranylgeranylglyceryl/heptaprenylglyceryl phosphate synthase [Saprospiraceae bacterium]|nr:geranylgeranylglyceryl/heptaprenylglyceryl phosphate synthase [Saprospiraceae bacterium]
MNKDHLYKQILLQKQKGRKSLAVLLDPDHIKSVDFDLILRKSIQSKVDFFFIGGSLILDDAMPELIRKIKIQTNIPVVIFPGNGMQIHNSADAILLLSLVSGRNPEYLIGKQVEASMTLRNSGLEIIPTAYILIDGGQVSSTAYITQTIPIPADRFPLALATAIAAEQLGFKLIYLEAGSGASTPISNEMVSCVSQSIQIPLITGGGIKNGKACFDLYKNGVDLIVVGNALEQNPQLVTELIQARDDAHQIHIDS